MCLMQLWSSWFPWVSCGFELVFSLDHGSLNLCYYTSSLYFAPLLVNKLGGHLQWTSHLRCFTLILVGEIVKKITNVFICSFACFNCFFEYILWNYSQWFSLRTSAVTPLQDSTLTQLIFSLILPNAGRQAFLFLFRMKGNHFLWWRYFWI